MEVSQGAENRPFSSNLVHLLQNKSSCKTAFHVKMSLICIKINLRL